MQPKLFIAFFLLIALYGLSLGITSCSSKGKPTFCDTTYCLKDTLKFNKSESPLKPYVYISPKDCMGDEIIMSYIGAGINRKLEFGRKINPDYVTCYIKDTSYAWLLFNTCEFGRGYAWKLPFSRTGRLNKANGALNKFDPKFAVADGIVAYTDKGNLFMEDMETGKKAMMTFGKQLDLDFDAIHLSIDSVNITKTRAWAKVKIGDDWKEIEKNISFE